MDNQFSKYNLEHKGVVCTGANWHLYVFLFEYKGVKYEYHQKCALRCIADTDHIRFVIEEFLEEKGEMV